MAKEDRDLVEKALDAAEAKINGVSEVEEESLLEVAEEETKVPEEEEEEDGEETEVEEPEEEPVKVEAKTPKKASKKAGTTDLSGQVADVETVKEDVPEVEAQSPIDPPTFWPAEKKAIFAKAPRELQEAFLEVDAQRNEWANRVARESERGKSIEKRAQEVFEPYKLKLQANGIEDPFQAASRLLAWNEIFETDPLTGIMDLMRKNGITPHDLMYGQANGHAEPELDPRIEQIRREAEEAKKSAEALKAQIEQQQTFVLKSQIEDFKAGKDSSGQIRKGFAELYAPQITQVVQSIQTQNPDIPVLEAINQAYEYVLGEVKKIHGVGGKPNTQEQVVQQAKKAQAAASSVSGAPSKGVAPSKPKAKTLEEALDMAEEAVYGTR